MRPSLLSPEVGPMGMRPSLLSLLGGPMVCSLHFSPLKDEEASKEEVAQDEEALDEAGAKDEAWHLGPSAE